MLKEEIIKLCLFKRLQFAAIKKSRNTNRLSYFSAIKNTFALAKHADTVDQRVFFRYLFKQAISRMQKLRGSK